MNNRINISVNPYYIPERSDPLRPYYVFAYHVTIKNNDEETFTLISRHWHITDGQGNIEDIYGPGVIGKTPTLKPGDSFEYTSFCPLKTPMGFMEGSFRMSNPKGHEIDAKISRFRLVAPQVLN